MGNPTPLEQRSTCEALVITCSDFRFKTAEQQFASVLTDDYDLIARPGAARSLVQPRTPEAEKTMWDEIRLLYAVHHFPRIILLNHLSCRAYDDIATPETQHAVHAKHLREAAQRIRDQIEGVKVEGHIVAFVDGWRAGTERIV